MKTFTKPRPIPYLSGVAVLCFALTACSSSGETQLKQGATSGGDPALPVGGVDSGFGRAAETTSAEPVLTARIIRLPKGSRSAQKTFTAFTRGIREARLTARRPGRIVALAVGLGERVESGQTLIRLDSSLERLAVDAALARRESAAAGQRQAARDWARAQELFAEASISPAQLENAQFQNQTATAAYDGAVAELGVARQNLSETSIVAPFDGEVAGLPYEVGETPIPGSYVVEITDRSRLIADIFLTEEDLQELKVGLTADILVAGDSLKSRTGILRALSPRGNDRTGLFKGEVVVDNHDLFLRAGVTGRVLFASRRPEHPVVPVSAIVTRAGPGSQPMLAVVTLVNTTDENQRLKVVLRNVTLGKRVGAGMASGVASGVIVLSGLEFGERIVVSGGQTLKDGQALRTLKEVPLDSLLN